MIYLLLVVLVYFLIGAALATYTFSKVDNAEATTGEWFVLIVAWPACLRLLAAILMMTRYMEAMAKAMRELEEEND